MIFRNRQCIIKSKRDKVCCSFLSPVWQDLNIAAERHVITQSLKAKGGARFQNELVIAAVVWASAHDFPEGCECLDKRVEVQVSREQTIVGYAWAVKNLVLMRVFFTF